MIQSIRTDSLIAAMNGKLAFEQAAPDTLRVIAPFFHEDGEMYDIFLQEIDGRLQLCDFGMTLMRLSYKTDLDTEGKLRVFSKIIANNGVECDKGNLLMFTSYEHFFTDLMQYQVAISKVTNLDILKRETVSNLFYEQFSSYVSGTLGKKFQKVVQHYHPTDEQHYEVDYAILDKADCPFYILAVKDSLSALRATTLCLKMATLGRRHISIAVHDSAATIAARDKDALTNAVDKQYTSLHDFEENGESFIIRQSA